MRNHSRGKDFFQHIEHTTLTMLYSFSAPPLSGALMVFSLLVFLPRSSRLPFFPIICTPPLLSSEIISRLSWPLPFVPLASGLSPLRSCCCTCCTVTFPLVFLLLSFSLLLLLNFSSLVISSLLAAAPLLRSTSP